MFEIRLDHWRTIQGITQGLLMAEELNMNFSSVFTREDTRSLHVPETKCSGYEAGVYAG